MGSANLPLRTGTAATGALKMENCTDWPILWTLMAIEGAALTFRASGRALERCTIEMDQEDL